MHGENIAIKSIARQKLCFENNFTSFDKFLFGLHKKIKEDSSSNSDNEVLKRSGSGLKLLQRAFNL